MDEIEVKKSVSHQVADKIDIAACWLRRNGKTLAIGAGVVTAAVAGAIVAGMLSENKVTPTSETVFNQLPEEGEAYTEIIAVVEETAAEPEKL